MGKIAVLRENLRNNWHAIEERNLTFKNLTSIDFYYWNEEVPETEIYDVSEMFHDRSLRFLEQKKSVIVTTEEPSVLQTEKYLSERGYQVKKIIEKPKHFIARTSWTRDTLLQLGVDGDKISIIPFAVDLEKFQPRKEIVHKYSFPTFLYAGSLSFPKGVDTLINAFKKLNAGNLILLSGEFNNDPIVENLAAQTENVSIIKWSTDIERIYNQADIYVQPQSYGFNTAGGILHFGKPMQWALASGLPIISLDQGSARDFVENFVNGFLCKTNDEIFTKMSRLVEYEDNVREMGQRSRVKAEDEFSPDVVSTQYCEALGNIF